MAGQTLKVGIIGGSIKGRWGGRVHVPVFQALPETEVVALCTGHEETAKEAAEHFGVPHAFSDYHEMVQLEEIDIVSISVQAGLHHPMAMAALQAGKHLFCEWPLAVDSHQAIEMHSLAREKRLRHSVGLQARCSPEVMYLKEIIQDGYVGTPLVFNMSHLDSPALRPRTSAEMYHMKREGGGSELLIGVGHTLDLLQEVLGDITALSGKTDTLVRRQVLTDTGEDVEVTSIDNVAVVAELKSGAMGIIQNSRTTQQPSEGWRLLISGTEGKLIVTSPRYPMLSLVQIVGTRKGSTEPETLLAPDRLKWVSEVPYDDTSFNTAQLVRRFVQGIHQGEDVTPNFEHGIRLHKLLEAVEASRSKGWVTIA